MCCGVQMVPPNWPAEAMECFCLPPVTHSLPAHLEGRPKPPLSFAAGAPKGAGLRALAGLTLLLFPVLLWLTDAYIHKGRFRNFPGAAPCSLQ